MSEKSLNDILEEVEQNNEITPDDKSAPYEAVEEGEDPEEKWRKEFQEQGDLSEEEIES